MANADLALRKQLDEDWNYWMTQYPETATALGYPGQNARWTDYSAHAISERERYLEESAKRLAKIDTKQLSAADRIDYAIYRDALEAAVAGVALHNDAAPMKGVIPHNLLMPMNQMEGIQQEIPHVLAMMPRTTHEEYDNIVRRLERVAELVEQTIALMQRG